MQNLVEHVINSIDRAQHNDSKITPEIIALDGMTGIMTRHFYNNLLSMDDARYLEIGTWKGSSVCAAMCNNSASVIAIDNFSEFGGPRQELLANFNHFRGANDATFIEGDSFAMDISEFPKFNIYLYDGDHSEKCQYDALKYYYDHLDDEFIFIVDDWNWQGVRNGTLAAIAKLDFTILYEKRIRLTYDESHTPQPMAHDTWHNGLFVVVLKKGSGERKMRSALVRTYGFFGDGLFAGSLAKKLHEDGYDRVVYLNGQPQMLGFYQRNPWIEQTYSTPLPAVNTHHIPVPETFDIEICIPEYLRVTTPCEQMQAGVVQHPSADFITYTHPVLDEYVRIHYKDTPYVVVMEPLSWAAKTYVCTPEQYNAMQPPVRGYAGSQWVRQQFPQRDIQKILALGLPDGTKYQFVGVPPGHDGTTETLELTASLIKNAKAFIGVEGGLANFAAGAGVRTLLTGEFTHVLWGPNGVMNRIAQPRVGPHYYFPNAGHVEFDPFLTDEQLAAEIKKCLL